MLFSKEERKKMSRKGSWLVGALAFVGAAGIVNKCKKAVGNACSKMKDMMHKEGE